MGSWERQQENIKETKEKDKNRKDKLAGFFFNLAQVSFVTLVAGLLITLTKDSLYDNYILMILVVMGIILTVVFARIGNNLLK